MYLQLHTDDFNMYTNMEKKYKNNELPDIVLSMVHGCHHGPGLVFFDVGANIGHVSTTIFSLWGKHQYREETQFLAALGFTAATERYQRHLEAAEHSDPIVHAFEPQAALSDYLEMLKGTRFNSSKWRINQMAVGGQSGTMLLYDGNEFQDGHPNPASTDAGLHRVGHVLEEVRVTTIDDYVKQHAINKIALVKIGTSEPPLLYLGCISGGSGSEIMVSFSGRCRGV